MSGNAFGQEPQHDRAFDIWRNTAWDMRHLTRAEYEVHLNDFRRLDTNHNGMLEGEEIAKLLSIQLQGEPTEGELRAFMAEFDSDCDNAISFAEYMNVVNGKGWTVDGRAGTEATVMYFCPEESFDTVVQAVDANRDGVLSMDELTAFQKMLFKLEGVDVTPEKEESARAEAKAMVEELGDGKNLPAARLRDLLRSMIEQLGMGSFQALVENSKVVVAKTKGRRGAISEPADPIDTVLRAIVEPSGELTCRGLAKLMLVLDAIAQGSPAAAPSCDAQQAALDEAIFLCTDPESPFAAHHSANNAPRPRVEDAGIAKEQVRPMLLALGDRIVAQLRANPEHFLRCFNAMECTFQS